jgi:hypothetical protein
MMPDSKTARPKILVLHALQEISRNTTFEFTGSFGRHAKGCEVHYLNLYGVVASREIASQNYDLLIVTYEVLAQRAWVYWPEIQQRVARISKSAKRTVFLPQDDYTFSSRLDDLAIACEVSAIWSPIAKNVELLYPRSAKKGIRFELALTGYVERERLKEYEGYSRNFDEREIDLGQRVSLLPSNFGKIAQRKAEIAIRLGDELQSRGFKVDVSTRPEDSFSGSSWLEFLGNTRFTVSRKGGAGIGDPLNKFSNRVAFLQLFSSIIGKELFARLSATRGVVLGDFSAVSPRLLEAAALGVCQILEEDDYLDGAIMPWIHYVPLKSDFSNVDEIANFMSSGGRIQEMIQNARHSLIESGNFTYESFVLNLLEKEIGAAKSTEPPTQIDLDSGSKFASGESVESYRESLAVIPAWKALFDRAWKASYLTKFREVTELESIPEVLFLDWVGI